MQFVDTTPRTEAEMVLEHIKEHPEVHAHFSIEELQRCCTVMHEGQRVIDTQLLDAHSETNPIGFNGGQACDVLDGPCACGAWHKLEEDRKGLTPLGQAMRRKQLEKRK